MKPASIFTLLTTSITLAHSFRQPPIHSLRRRNEGASTTHENTNQGNSTFQQLISHSNASVGIFSQWYAYDTTHYAGPGSPIVLFTPGELNASLYTNYLTTKRLTGALAKRIGGAVILLEHRYWGVSSPFTELTTANLKYLTLEDSVLDIVNFARNVELPFARDGSSNADAVPWVMVGASYSGALAAWVESIAPGTIWAYQASSAIVEAIEDFWGYYLPVQEGMPANCSKDVALVIDYMDDVLMHGSKQEVHDLKALFGLESIAHNDDFMNALTWGPAQWQDNQFAYSSGFYTWCDYIENSVNQTDPSKIPGPDGLGVHKALHGYARWARYYFRDFCKEAYGYFPSGFNTECFDTHNASNPMFTDTSLSNTVYRGWIWFQCSWPTGWFQNGAPSNRRSIVSRLLDVEYWSRQCDLYFPPGPSGETYHKNSSTATLNSYTEGWKKRNTTRLQYTNGQFDPWREAGVSAQLRPGGPLLSSEQTPIKVVPGGFHGSDLVMENGDVNEGCREVQEAEIAQLVKWVGEWPGYH